MHWLGARSDSTCQNISSVGDKKHGNGINGSRCDVFSASAWAADLKRQHLVHCGGGQVTALSAQILRLDQILRRYGPETAQSRELLRQYAELKMVDLFPDNPADVRLGDQSTYERLQQLEDSLLALKPANTRDQWWLGQATTLAGKIGDARWQLAQQVGQGTPNATAELPRGVHWSMQGVYS